MAVPSKSPAVKGVQIIRAAFTDILHFPGRVVITTADPLTSARTARSVLEELSGVSERPMIIPMTTTGRLLQRL